MLFCLLDEFFIQLLRRQYEGRVHQGTVFLYNSAAEQLGLVYAQFEKALDKQVQLMNIEIRYPVTTLMRVLKRIKAPKKASYEAMDYFVAIHGDSPCTAYELFMQMSDVIFSAQCDGASGQRIAQLEEIVSRALNVNWHEYDHPGDFKW